MRRPRRERLHWQDDEVDLIGPCSPKKSTWETALAGQTGGIWSLITVLDQLRQYKAKRSKMSKFRVSLRISALSSGRTVMLEKAGYILDAGKCSLNWLLSRFGDCDAWKSWWGPFHEQEHSGYLHASWWTPWDRPATFSKSDVFCHWSLFQIMPLSIRFLRYRPWLKLIFGHWAPLIVCLDLYGTI